MSEIHPGADQASPEDLPRTPLDALPEPHLVLQQKFDALQLAHRALQETAERHRILLDESTDPIFMFSPDGTYQYVNLAFASGVDRPLALILGKRIWDVFSKDEADMRFAVVAAVFANKQIKVIEVRVPRANGDHYYVTSVKPVLDKEGQVSSVICISKDITERKAMEDRLAYLAQYDQLTNLPNRALFDDRFTQAIAQAHRSHKLLAVMALDLDKFKSVNDNLGHQAGDALLTAVAGRIQACLRESDTVARIGGDEFVILLPSVTTLPDALAVADKGCAALNHVFDLTGFGQVHISSSMGVAIFPDHGGDKTTLLKVADDAMYLAKNGGGNQVRLHRH